MYASITAGILGALAATSLPSVALAQLHGQERVEAAEAAYDEGVHLYGEGDYTEAGRAFERADALLPARAAMENAIRAYREGGDDRRAATVASALVERDASARRQARFVPAVAERSFKLIISCDAPCSLSVDGEETRYRTFFFAPNEPHFFRASFDTGVRETASTGEAGEVRELVLEAPEPDEQDGEGPPDIVAPNDGDRGRQSPSDDDSGGIGVLPLWATLSAAAVTAGLAGVTIWSGIDTESARADYDAAPTLDKLEAGQAKETRTNVLLGVTIGMGVLTVAMAVFTDWGGGDEDGDDASVRFGVGPMDGGAVASISGTMP
jgi:hypothetical protein